MTHTDFTVASRVKQSRALVGIAACLLSLIAGCSSEAPTPALPSSTASQAPSDPAVVNPDSDSTGEPGSPGRFQSLAIGAGGFVTGMSISSDGATRLVRTDGFGGYRWDAKRDQWVLDVSAETLPEGDVSPGLGSGVLAVTVAPSDASRVYMAYNNSLYRSDDGAQSWRAVLRDVSTAPNDDFRSWGSRLSVDPQNPDVVYYGSQLQGLYISNDGGSSWSTVPIDVVPAGQVIDLDGGSVDKSLNRTTNVDGDVEGQLSSTGQPSGSSKKDGSRRSGGKDRTRVATAGISATAVDPNGPVLKGISQIVYAASFGSGLFRSDDAGRTWDLISVGSVGSRIGSIPYLRVLDDGSVMVLSHETATDLSGFTQVLVWRQGAWADRTPSQPIPARDALNPAKDGAKWRAVAVDPTTPGRVAMIAVGGQLALSSDDGLTWQLPTRQQTSSGDVGWLAWAQDGPEAFFTPGELVFDPVDSGRLWLTEGTGVWFVDLGGLDGSVGAVTWNSRARGIEQLVPTDVIAPPGGKPVVSAWDRPLFRSEEPDAYPATYGPTRQFGAAWALDWSVTDPEYLVANVASQQAPNDPSNSGFSTDGGRTWEAFPSIPLESTDGVGTFGFGSMAVSRPGNVVWVPAYGRRPMYTKDGGQTWNNITLPGVDNYAKVDNQAYYVNRKVIAADKATPDVFYLYVSKSGIFRSMDGGDTWSQMSDDRPFRPGDYGYSAQLKAAPGRPGELFITPGKLSDATDPTSVPFKRSTDAGESWSDVPGVTGVSAFGFGSPMPGSNEPSVFLAGYVNERYGVFRSDDGGDTWTFLTDYPDGRPNDVVAIDGDKVIPGRVYLGIGGSGWVYGS